VSGEFSVCQFFADDSYEYDVRNVDAKTAMDCFAARIRSVGAKIGTTKRVIVTDGGDSTNVEWKHGEGIVYPTELRGMS